jgi:hypothetical protein
MLTFDVLKKTPANEKAEGVLVCTCQGNGTLLSDIHQACFGRCPSVSLLASRPLKTTAYRHAKQHLARANAAGILGKQTETRSGCPAHCRDAYSQQVTIADANVLEGEII